MFAQQVKRSAWIDCTAMNSRLSFRSIQRPACRCCLRDLALIAHGRDGTFEGILLNPRLTSNIVLHGTVSFVALGIVKCHYPSRRTSYNRF
jgi:hypothetical protein